MSVTKCENLNTKLPGIESYEISDLEMNTVNKQYFIQNCNFLRKFLSVKPNLFKFNFKLQTSHFKIQL